jgi:hypothetical protein
LLLLRAPAGGQGPLGAAAGYEPLLPPPPPPPPWAAAAGAHFAAAAAEGSDACGAAAVEDSAPAARGDSMARMLELGLSTRGSCCAARPSRMWRMVSL